MGLGGRCVSVSSILTLSTSWEKTQRSHISEEQGIEEGQL
jgi:hypothetical protein